MEVDYLNIRQVKRDLDKLTVMSFGHKKISQIMFEEKAIGTFIYPDTVFFDGTFSHAQRVVKTDTMLFLLAAHG